MGLPVSIILIAVGLVLALAVHPASSGAVDVNTVGWIIFAVGALGLLLALLFWDSWAGGGYFRRRHYVAHDPGYAGYGPGYGTRRRTVVEEDDAPPPAPPY
jgi:hypothetical protein